jgi:predicted unusual protein kinase regulating ubiquinone biosynthesis (AarF/ABC1/UbiB family)
MRPIDRVRRSTRVIWTASSIFLGYKRVAFTNRKRSPEEAQRRLSEYHRKAAERILVTATDLQGLLIKVGQLIGARADIFPDEYIEVLSRLHDTVPPRPYSVMRPVIERELGERIEEIFAEFDPTPIASASLAQVYRGRLKDGRDVAVKVQYPDIEEIVRVDLQNVAILTQGAKRILRDFDFTPVVEELNTNAPLELDFINEGQNAEEAARNFAARDDIVVPTIYWEYTTRHVLTMEFLEGIKITDIAAIDAAGIDHQAISRLLAESYFKQIFAHGFFHADPHPGNLFVRPGPKLIIVDFGLAKHLSPTFLRGFVRLTAALIAGDKGTLIQAFKDLGFKTKLDDDSGFEALGEAMVTRLGRNDEFVRNRRMLTEFNDRMMKLFRENPIVRVPGEFLYIGRVMGLLGGLGTQLGSEVNLLEVLGAELTAVASPAS